MSTPLDTVKFIELILVFLLNLYSEENQAPRRTKFKYRICFLISCPWVSSSIKSSRIFT